MVESWFARGVFGRRAQNIKHLELNSRSATGAWLMDNPNAALIAPATKIEQCCAGPTSNFGRENT